MSSFGDDLIAAMGEAAEHARGKGRVARVHRIEVPDADGAAARASTGLSQDVEGDADER